jgi:hypothetical protein
VCEIRRGARHDSVADADGYEMPSLDRQVLPGAQVYGVGRGQLGQYHQTQPREKRLGDDACGIMHDLWGEDVSEEARCKMDNQTYDEDRV